MCIFSENIEEIAEIDQKAFILKSKVAENPRIFYLKFEDIDSKDIIRKTANRLWPLFEKFEVKKLSVDLETMQVFYLEILSKSLLEFIASDEWSFTEVRFVIEKGKEFEKAFDSIKKYGNPKKEEKNDEEAAGEEKKE